MNIKLYDYMCEDIVHIRTVVFVEEQKFEYEFDDIDNNCIFLVAYDMDKPIAMCRYFPIDKDTYAIGRIAVMKDYRGKGLGGMIVEEAERHVKEAGAIFATLSAQVRVKEFYERLGYAPEGETYYEEYCEHIKMKKRL